MRKIRAIVGAVPILVAGLLFPAPAQAADQVTVELTDGTRDNCTGP